MDLLQSLEEEFAIINDNRLCLTLNTYGLTGNNFCSKSNPGIKITSIDNLITMAKSTLLFNKKFTNVIDTSYLEVDEVLMMPFSDSTHFRIVFKNQQYSGYKVHNTQIVLWMYATGVYRINGHWYQDIFVPERDSYNIEDSKKSIIGLDITYYDKRGNQVIFNVSNDSFRGIVKKIIFPIENMESIELRVTWQIGVGWNESADPLWYVYVDTTTNKVIQILQLFVT